MVGCVIVGAVITLIATIAPAQRAAIMPAAAALRTEV
jgi:ABC-type lipoprotein release transport system permease subunit